MKKLLACGLVALSVGAAVMLSGLDSARAFFANQGMFLARGTAAAPTATLSASPPGPVTAGTPVTLTWTSNQSSCTGSQSSGSDFSTGGLANGTDSVTPTSPSTSYTVTCGTATPASTTVAVTGGGGGVACDQGPNAPSIPAQATAAGLTHCVLNADFTTTTTDANGINWSNTATWLKECGLATPPTYKFRLAYGFGPFGSPSEPLAPCNHATWFTDTGGGGLGALDILYSIADQTAFMGGGTGRVTMLEYPMLYNESDPGSAPFPYEYYWEKTYRIPPSSLVVNLSIGTNGTIPIETWDIGWGAGSSTHQTSPDQIESQSKCTSPCTDVRNGYLAFWYPPGNEPPGGFVSCNGVACSLGPSYPNWDQYQTWGTLVTSDGNSVISLCSYRNSTTAEGCEWLTSNPGTDDFFTRRNSTLAIWVGDALCYNASPGCLVNDVHVYLQSMRVWSCSNYKFSNCPGTVITSEAASSTRFAWWDWFKRAVMSIIPQVHAETAKVDPFDGHATGWWICPDGHFDGFAGARCMPPELRAVVRWWDACVPGRTDCVWSDTAYLGKPEQYGRAKRGPGYCYTQQPVTCSPDAKPPPSP